MQLSAREKRSAHVVYVEFYCNALLSKMTGLKVISTVDTSHDECSRSETVHRGCSHCLSSTTHELIQKRHQSTFEFGEIFGDWKKKPMSFPEFNSYLLTCRHSSAAARTQAVDPSACPPWPQDRHASA